MATVTTCCAKPLWHNRCTGCGHRQAIGGTAPRQTREMAPWHWPGEIVNRARARREGR
jgi:hypothetical protein